ncbi:hypothetical protein D3C80_1874610 [compost metagenome]
MVMAVKASMASREANATSAISVQLLTPYSSKAGLKIQMKGRMTVRMPYSAP